MLRVMKLSFYRAVATYQRMHLALTVGPCLTLNYYGHYVER